MTTSSHTGWMRNITNGNKDEGGGTRGGGRGDTKSKFDVKIKGETPQGGGGMEIGGRKLGYLVGRLRFLLFLGKEAMSKNIMERPKNVMTLTNFFSLLL